MTLDKNGYAGALLMDLSKAFDCIDHEVLIVELYAHVKITLLPREEESLNTCQNYLLHMSLHTLLTH